MERPSKILLVLALVFALICSGATGWFAYKAGLKKGRAFGDLSAKLWKEHASICQTYLEYLVEGKGGGRGLSSTMRGNQDENQRQHQELIMALQRIEAQMILNSIQK